MSVDTVPDFKKVKNGDLIVLRDFHTLSAMGDEYSAQIKEVHTWKNDNLSYYGYEMEIDDEITLMLLARVVGDKSEARLFRLHDRCIANDFDAVSMFSFETTVDDEGDVDFTDFTIIHADEEEDGELTYGIKSPYPFWDMKTEEGKKVAICEYGALEDGLDNYWAMHAFVEWYADVGKNGEDGLVSVWFGWDIGDNDFSFIKG